MATPANRVPVRVARGTKTNIDTAVAAGDLKEGEVVYVTDENTLYVIEGGVLTKAGVDLAASSIDALSDVDTTTAAPTDGQALLWSTANSNWEPGTAGATALDGLTDVDTTTVAPVDGDTLVYDNANSEFIPGVRVKSDTTQGGTGSSAVANIVSISQVDYDALATPDANTIYFIV